MSSLSEDKIRYYNTLSNKNLKNLNTLEDPFFSKNINFENNLKHPWEAEIPNYASRNSGDFYKDKDKSKTFNRVIMVNDDGNKCAAYAISQKSKFINSGDYVPMGFMGAGRGLGITDVESQLIQSAPTREFHHVSIMNYQIDRLYVGDKNFQDAKHSVLPFPFDNMGYPSRTIGKHHKYRT